MVGNMITRFILFKPVCTDWSSNSRPFIIGNLQSPPAQRGNCLWKQELNRSYAVDLTVVLQSYQPTDIRQSSLSWIDFWELGWVKDGAFSLQYRFCPEKEVKVSR